MNFRSILPNKKAVSNVIATVFLIGITVIAAGIVVGITMSYLRLKSDIYQAGEIEVEDFDRNGLFDTVSIPLMNKGMNDADIESVAILQNNETLLWYTLDRKVGISEIDDINLFALGSSEEIQPFVVFRVQVRFEDDDFISSGFVATLPSANSGNYSDGIPYYYHDYLVRRTSSDDAYGKSNFPTTVGFSPNLWFLLGEFEDNTRTPDISIDYIDLCGYGSEQDYLPNLLDTNTFTQGNIGLQSNHKIMPYNDSGARPGLIAFTKAGNWDTHDDLEWGERGLVYMWSYIYNPSSDSLTVNVGANGEKNFKVWFNGEYILQGNRKEIWYTKNSVTLNHGLNLIMMKVGTGPPSRFAGQVLLFNDTITDQLAQLYSVWADN